MLRPYYVKHECEYFNKNKFYKEILNSEFFQDILKYGINTFTSFFMPLNILEPYHDIINHHSNNIINKNDFLSIYYLNGDGKLNYHFNIATTFYMDILKQQPSIFALAESGNADIKNNNLFNNYNKFRILEYDNSGGITMYIKKIFKNEYNCYKNTNEQYIRLYFDKCNLYIFVVYFSYAKQGIRRFNKFIQYINILDNLNYHVLIVGDVNAQHPDYPISTRKNNPRDK